MFIDKAHTQMNPQNLSFVMKQPVGFLQTKQSRLFETSFFPVREVVHLLPKHYFSLFRR